MVSHLRRYLIAGLLVWVPLAATLLVVKLLVDAMDQTLAVLPDGLHPELLFGFNIPGLGVLLSLAVVLLTGVGVANLFGRRMVEFWEGMLVRIPLVRSIYSGVKQVAETMLTSSGQSFRKVVMVEFPRPGAWSLAFLTGTATGEVQ